MNKFKLTSLIFSLFLCQTPFSYAAMVRVDQVWHHKNYGIGTPPNLFNLSTAVFFSDSTITSTNIEKIMVEFMGILRFDDMLGLNFSVADFNEPYDLNTEGNIFAQHNNGIFEFLKHVDQGGSARITLRTGDLAGSVSGSININANELIYYFPVSGKHTYLLQSTTISTIPIPGALSLLTTGLFGIGFLTRRKLLPTNQLQLG